jgi:hypothetical protein
MGSTGPNDVSTDTSGGDIEEKKAAPKAVAATSIPAAVPAHRTAIRAVAVAAAEPFTGRACRRRSINYPGATADHRDRGLVAGRPTLAPAPSPVVESAATQHESRGDGETATAPTGTATATGAGTGTRNQSRPRFRKIVFVVGQRLQGGAGTRRRSHLNLVFG